MILLETDPVTTSGWVELLGAIVGGGVIASVLNFLLGKKESKRKDIDNLINRLTQEIERISKENEELRKKEEENRERIAQLEKNELHNQYRLALFESAHNDKPFPEWLKDLDGTMLTLNKAYEDVFLRPYGLTMHDYIGANDADIWPEDMATAYRENDSLALTSPDGFISTRERIVTKSGKDLGEWEIIKFVRTQGGVPVGIGGIATPIHD